MSVDERVADLSWRAFSFEFNSGVDKEAKDCAQSSDKKSSSDIVLLSIMSHLFRH